MLDKETIKKNEYIYENLPQKSREVIEEYKKVLNITEEQSKKIITHNVSAIVWVCNKNWLRLKGIEYVVKMLIKCTLFRESNEMFPITEEEKRKVKKYYNIDLDNLDEKER